MKKLGKGSKVKMVNTESFGQEFEGQTGKVVGTIWNWENKTPLYQVRLDKPVLVGSIRMRETCCYAENLLAIG